MCLVWIKVTIDSWSVIPPTLAQIPEPNERDLAKFVKTDAPYKLGVQLGVDVNDLKNTEKNHPNNHDKQLLDVFSFYMKQSCSPSWMEVATALWEIGEKRNAKDIAKRYGMAYPIIHKYT